MPTRIMGRAVGGSDGYQKSYMAPLSPNMLRERISMGSTIIEGQDAGYGPFLIPTTIGSCPVCCLTSSTIFSTPFVASRQK